MRRDQEIIVRARELLHALNSCLHGEPDVLPFDIKPGPEATALLGALNNLRSSIVDYDAASYPARFDHLLGSMAFPYRWPHELEAERNAREFVAGGGSDERQRQEVMEAEARLMGVDYAKPDEERSIPHPSTKADDTLGAENARRFREQLVPKVNAKKK